MNNKIRLEIEDRYLKRAFDEWFTMQLDFPDERTNEIIRDVAILSFLKGYRTPKPNIGDYINNLIEAIKGN